MRLLALILLLQGCAALRTIPRPREAEALRAKTDDGWEISLTRYRAQGASTGRPVLLCHGISANDRNMDLDDTHSMARWFAAHGREAWTMSLRATGGSDGIDPAKGRPGPIFFDDYWKHDLPAAVAFVRAQSGADAIDYVGHSMGGMTLYAYLAEGGQGIHAAVTLGSPTRLDWGTPLEALIETFAPALVSSANAVPSAVGAGLINPIQPFFDDGPLERFFYNPRNTTHETWAHLLAYGTADVAGGTALQLLELIRRGRFTSADGAIDFRRDMAAIHTPILVVAGRVDRIALAPSVRDGYRALGGPKEWWLVSRANGASVEYGHMDFVIGERAPVEVWPRLLAFLGQP